MKHVLLIDHYDSFTQLIKSYFEQLGALVTILQSDKLVLSDICAIQPTHFVFSPGPGHPKEAHQTRELILKFYQTYPMLGICLGHQCLVEAFGGDVVRASEICHGKTAEVYHTGAGLFEGFEQPFRVTRYHSLVASNQTLPKDFEVTAWTHDSKGEAVIMGIQYRHAPLFGVQYHPEAILTANGSQIFEHFLSVSI